MNIFPTNSTIVIIALIFVNIYAIDPPIWPVQFTQSLIVEEPDGSSTGKYWYDSANNKSRFDYEDGSPKYFCGLFFGNISTPCTYLVNNNTFFAYQPYRKLCCTLGKAQVQPRDWLTSYKYVGQRVISNQRFDLWQYEDSNEIDEYYADKSEQKIMRRQFYKSKEFQDSQFTIDYWVQSYSEKPIDQETFSIPNYCSNPKRCPTSGNKLNIFGNFKN